MHDQTHEDRRLFSRINFQSDACIVQDHRRVPCHLVDISLNGVLIEANHQIRLKKDLPYTLQIQLSDEARITMQIELIHTSSQLLGFQCISIDMESVSHLRRLIEMNIGEPEASKRVLTELVRRQRAD